MSIVWPVRHNSNRHNTTSPIMSTLTKLNPTETSQQNNTRKLKKYVIRRRWRKNPMASPIPPWARRAWRRTRGCAWCSAATSRRAGWWSAFQEMWGTRQQSWASLQTGYCCTASCPATTAASTRTSASVHQLVRESDTWQIYCILLLLVKTPKEVIINKIYVCTMLNH